MLKATNEELLRFIDGAEVEIGKLVRLETSAEEYNYQNQKKLNKAFENRKCAMELLKEREKTTK